MMKGRMLGKEPQRPEESREAVDRHPKEKNRRPQHSDKEVCERKSRRFYHPEEGTLFYLDLENTTPLRERRAPSQALALLSR